MSRRLSTILVIEDDAPIRRGVVDTLRFAGFHVVEAADGVRGLALALENTVDLVLLDVMMPGMDGFAVLKSIRAAHPSLPVIMVTARGAEDDRVRGLRGGADDYVAKPFSAMELLARVEAVLRRSPARPMTVALLRTASGTIDLQRREIRLSDGGREELSEREGAVLSYLAGCRDRVVDRKELLQNVWGLDPRGLETRTVDMQIARLREKLGTDAEGVIATVRGKGYKLADGIKVEGPGTP